MRARLAVCCLAFALSACATGGASHGSGHDPNAITADEIEASHEATAYDVVRTLRPNMLITHGVSSFNQSDPGIMVFVNGTQFGTIQSLDRIAAKDVDEIHFYSASEASLRHGTGFPDGVIEVKTK
ncbi:MAG TPA: hypothetical protein VIC24_00980 [Gemmatimonadaceae bacterium]|jgi:hypothetical protein